MQNASVTTAQAFESVSDNAKRHSNARGKVNALAVGEHVRQGDIYIERRAKKPAYAKNETTERQLAPGTSKGSRHIADGPDLQVYPRPGTSALTGPIIVAGKPWLLRHPEHAVLAMPAGIFSVCYQRDFSERAKQTKAPQRVYD